MIARGLRMLPIGIAADHARMGTEAGPSTTDGARCLRIPVGRRSRVGVGPKCTASIRRAAGVASFPGSTPSGARARGPCKAGSADRDGSGVDAVSRDLSVERPFPDSQ